MMLRSVGAQAKIMRITGATTASALSGVWRGGTKARRCMRLTVNGEEHELALQGNETLLAVLRERLELTGTKLGCGRGECGACTVLVDGRLSYSCLTLAAGCAGQAVTTVEGLGTSADPHPLQRSFIELDALQCGFCTPGQLMAAAAL